MRKFWRILKKVLLYSIGTVLLLLGLAIFIAWAFEDKIKGLAVQELNKHLQAEVLIDGSNIHFSLIRNFPNASLSFENFKIRESYPGSKKNFAEVGRLAFVFNTLDLINGVYKVKKIDLSDATVIMRLNREGIGNYLFWKSSPPAAAANQEAISIDLKHIALKNVKYSYQDDQAAFLTSVNIHKADLSGHFSDVQYDLSANADLFVDTLRSSDLVLISGKDVKLNTILAINSEKESYGIKESKLRFNKAGFAIAGMAVNKKDGVDLDFKVKGDETDIQTLLSLLPSQWSKYLAEYRSTGKILFDASIKGMAGGNHVPAMRVDFGIRNGTIKEQSKSLALQDVNFKGLFTNGEARNNKSSVLEIDDFHAKLNGRDLNGSCKLQNLDDPYLTLSLAGNLNLADVKNFTTLEQVKQLDGELFLDASFRGRIADLKTYSSIGRTTMAGKIMIREVNLWYQDAPAAYAGMNGQFVFDGNNLLIDDFTGKFANTDFRVNGAFKNLASYLFLKDQQLEVDAGVQCNLFKLDDFMTSSSSASDTVYSFSFPMFLVCDMRMQVTQFEYGKMKASQMTGRLVLRDKMATLSNIRLNTMGGTVTANAQMEELQNGNIRTYVKADLANIDVSQLFYEMDNFGQDFFTNKNIKGNMRAKVEYSSSWKPNLDADLGSIAATADITIDNGQIVGFEPLIKMGKFLKISSLDNLSFSRLTNQVSIKDQKIIISQMDLNSNAMNMSLAGTHTFSNVMDYKLKLNVSQLLFGKKQNYETEFGEVEVDPNGGMNLFLTMTGPGDSPKIAYDRKSSVQNFKKGLKQEKDELKNIFTGNNTPSKTPDGRPTEDLNKPQKDYQISFDEDEEDNTLNGKDKQNEPVSTPTQTDLKRKKAFEDLKKKLGNKPQ